MITMTTRSSRFFVVLLHLVGVSTHVPGWKSGIVGVNPLSIVLETLDPSSFAPDYFDSENDSSDADAKIQLLHGQPHWLQDVLGDQSCLDPMGGFSECGDATLWLVIPKKSSRRQARWRKWITWATEEEETEENTSTSRVQGYALQLYDESQQQQPYISRPENKEANGVDELASSLASSSFTSTYNNYHAKRPLDDLAQKECLTRRRRDNQLVLVPCSQDRAWAWHFNEHGILHFKKPKNSAQLGGHYDDVDAKRDKHKRLLKKDGKKTLECLGRNASKAAILMPCSGTKAPSIPESASELERILQIGLVRQATADSILAADARRSLAEKVEAKQEEPATPEPERRFPPSPFDIAHSHAAISGQRVELKTSTGRTSLSNKSSSSSTPAPPTSHPLLYFKDTNPILLATGTLGLTQDESSNKPNAKKTISVKSDKTATGKVGTSTTLPPSGGSANRPSKPIIRKIQTNPYISESKDERWIDPQTGLVYHTDLCRYLGHDRKEVGRHTITGVGQYMKTVFNIKVYGVAFYVSKRDILADPVMERYASMTVEELRQEPNFYETLRFMAPSTNPVAGRFDRTLFLKTNMQLATDTMRSSLDADWKMLTQEAKDLLIGASMKARPASDAMMEAIQSPDNPSKCSCAQLAPEEYGADPACCARGTELVFTWRKEGFLEVRLNGDLIDSFERPDIAAAIFYEYLRTDDPMSFDFLEHVVEGFPMLLGPLSQVKGVGSPGSGHSTSSPNSQQKASGGQNPLTRALEGVGEVLSSGASSVVGLVQHGANELGSGAMVAARSVGDAARTMGDAARNLGEEVERRRELIGKHVSHFAHQTISSFYSGGKDQKAIAALPKWLESLPFDIPFNNDTPADTKESRGRLFKNSHLFSKLFGASERANTAAPDEIVPMIHPSANSTQRLFLGIVHLYLLLILIVSFPANLTTRTRLIITRKSRITGVQPVSDSDSEEGSLTESEGSLKNSHRNTSSKNGIKRGFPTFTKRPYRSPNI